MCFFVAGSNVDYICFEENLLPEFPLKTPATFQILESDCKINPLLVEQLRFRFLECQYSNAEEFINDNLNNMLTRAAASVFSWTGTQGNIPLVKFKCMNVLIGWCSFSFQRIKIFHMNFIWFSLYFGLFSYCRMCTIGMWCCNKGCNCNHSRLVFECQEINFHDDNNNN